MITLREALEKKYLRPVAEGKNGYPMAYKNEVFEDFEKFIGKEVMLVNVEKKFLMLKDKELSNKTFTGANNKALVFIDNSEHAKGVKASDFIKVKLDQGALETRIVNSSSVYGELMIDSFAELAIKVIKEEKLTEKQLASLMCDKRTLEVFDMKDIFEVMEKSDITKNPELIEIVYQKTTRARLFAQEVKDGNSKPLSLSLFKSKELKDVIKLR